MSETKSYEIVIGEIQSELDRDHAEYQQLHRKIYFEEDQNAKLIYKQKTDLLKTLLKRIELYERS